MCDLTVRVHCCLLSARPAGKVLTIQSGSSSGYLVGNLLISCRTLIFCRVITKTNLVIDTFLMKRTRLWSRDWLIACDLRICFGRLDINHVIKILLNLSQILNNFRTMFELSIDRSKYTEGNLVSGLKKSHQLKMWLIIFPWSQI